MARPVKRTQLNVYEKEEVVRSKRLENYGNFFFENLVAIASTSTSLQFV